VHEFIKNVDHLNEDVDRFEARLDKFLQSEAL
jgi:ubiquinone biosynthesis protein UbiJ